MFDPFPYPLGFDISDNNGPINWGEVDPNYKFVAVKKSDGITFTAKTWAQNSASVQASGRRLIAYHYFEPGDDAELQAQNLVRGISLNPGDRTAMDIEGDAWAALDAPTRALKVQHFSAAVKDATGKNPMLYYAAGWFAELFNLADWQDWDHWVADLESGFFPCRVRQYSFTGTVRGVGNGTVDLDAWCGEW